MRKYSAPQNRSMIKYGVRAALQGHVLVSFAACLLPALLPMIIRFIPLDFLYLDILLIEPYIYRFSLIAMALSFIASVFVTDPMTVRVSAFFLQLNRNPEALPSPLSVCDCFSPGYLRMLTGMLQRNLRILAWAAIPVLIGALIPGSFAVLHEEGNVIIRVGESFPIFILIAMALYLYRSLVYTMVPYLLAEYPDASTTDIIRLSRAITRGRLGELLILQLSFIGWLLLASITLFVGAIYAYPYIEGTMAAYYLAFQDSLAKEAREKKSEKEAIANDDAP